MCFLLLGHAQICRSAGVGEDVGVWLMQPLTGSVDKWLVCFWVLTLWRGLYVRRCRKIQIFNANTVIDVCHPFKNMLCLKHADRRCSQQRTLWGCSDSIWASVADSYSDKSSQGTASISISRALTTHLVMIHVVLTCVCTISKLRILGVTVILNIHGNMASFIILFKDEKTHCFFFLFYSIAKLKIEQKLSLSN